METKKNNTVTKQEEDEEEMFLSQENESRNFTLPRADNELFNEDDNIANIVVSAKRVKLPRNGEDWEITVDGRTALKLKGTRFTNPEKIFLRTVDGMRFLISEYKSGNKSVVKIKVSMKRV